MRIKEALNLITPYLDCKNSVKNMFFLCAIKNHQELISREARPAGNFRK